MKYVTTVNNQQFEIEIGSDGEVTVNGEPRNVDFLSLGPALYSVITDNHSLEVVVDGESSQYQVLMLGHLYEAQVLDERALMMAQRRGTLSAGSGEVHSPMPGLIVDVPVAAGETVDPGQTVIILESMKMQNELKSPINGVVESVYCAAGQTVDKNALLIVIKGSEE